jgi:hypothetical protein
VDLILHDRLEAEEEERKRREREAAVRAEGAMSNFLTLVSPERIQAEIAHARDEIGLLSLQKGYEDIQAAGIPMSADTYREFLYEYGDPGHLGGTFQTAIDQGIIKDDEFGRRTATRYDGLILTATHFRERGNLNREDYWRMISESERGIDRGALLDEIAVLDPVPPQGWLPRFLSGQPSTFFQTPIPESALEKVRGVPVIGPPVARTAEIATTPIVPLTLPIGGLGAGALRIAGESILGAGVAGGVAEELGLPPKAQMGAELAGGFAPALARAPGVIGRQLAVEQAAARGFNVRPLTEGVIEAKPPVVPGVVPAEAAQAMGREVPAEAGVVAEQVAIPEAAPWQAEIEAETRTVADLPRMGGGAQGTVQFVPRDVAPSVVRPTKGLWAAVTNTVRTARGLPALTPDDFLRQAEARIVVSTYGKGIEEASRIGEAAINDYRRLVPEPPRLKPLPTNKAPQGLVGTELDILERPQAYQGGEQLANVRAEWQRYGNTDIADLQRRGIPIGAYEDYVFQHRYGDYFRDLGITDTSGVSASLRGRMPVQRTRQFTTAYDAYKASEGGVAVAADADGVLHVKLLPKDSTVKVGDSIQVGVRKMFGKETPIMGTVKKIGDPLIPEATDVEGLVGSRFSQTGLLRAQKTLLDSAASSAFNTARKGVPDGYKTLTNLPGPLADLKLLITDTDGKTRLITVRRLAWPEKVADTLQGLLAPTPLPKAVQTLTTATMALRDVRLNLDPSMITLIGSRYPLGHPVTFLRNAKEFGKVVPTASGYRTWLADDPMVKRFIDGGGGSFLGRMEYLPGERGPLIERYIPGLKQFNDLTAGRSIGYATVKTAQLNEQILRAVRGGMKLLGADKLGIPLTRIARMSDQEILEASVKSAMDQYGRLQYNALGISQWSKAGWRNSILTPGFIKTHLSLLTNAPKAFLGNPEGVLGLVFLTQYVAIMAGVAEGLSQIGGFHTSVDPRSVDLLAIKTGFGTWSAAGQIRTYIRIFANTPGDLKAGYYDRLYRSGLSRLGIVPNELAMQIKGEEYFGEPMGGPRERALGAGVRSLPIGLQTPAELALGKEQALDPVLASFADWSGATFWPRKPLDVLDEQMRKPPEQGGFGVGWWDAEPWQRQAIEEQHPELKKQADEALELSAKRGNVSAQHTLDLRRVNDKYNQEIAKAADTIKGNADFHRRFQEIQVERRAAIQSVESDPRYADVVAKSKERDAELLAQPVEGERNAVRLLAEYGAIFDRHEGEPTKDALFEELDTFWAGLTPNEDAALTRNLGLSLPPRAKEDRAKMHELQPYFNIPDTVYAANKEKLGLTAPSYSAYRTQATQEAQASAAAKGLGPEYVSARDYPREYTRLQDLIERERERYRRKNRDKTKLLIELGYKPPSKAEIARARGATGLPGLAPPPGLGNLPVLTLPGQ